MSVQNIELVRGEENTIHWLIPEPNMVEIRLQLVTDEAIVIMTQERFVEEGGGTGVYAIFNLGEIEDLDAQNGGASNYILKDTQYDEILFTGSVTLTGVGGGTPAEVVFEDLLMMKTDSAIEDIPITAAVELVQALDKQFYKKNVGETAWEDIVAAIVDGTVTDAKLEATLLAKQTDQRVPTASSVNFLKLTGDIKQWLINHGFESADQLIAPHTSLPNNCAIANTAGIYSWFVKQQRFNWDPTNAFASTVIHPAFTVDAAEKEIYIGKYQACLLSALGVVDNTSGVYAGSRPNVQQKSSVTFDQAQAFCEANNNGSTINGFHLMTNAEWATLQIKSIAGATQPFGNTNYGQDERDKSVNGRCYTLAQFGINNSESRWLTGSGGVKTSHNFDASGVFDLCGNVWEWVGGFRLKDGEIQILVDNNAANPAADMTLASASWKAILRDGTIVAPGTADTLKFDASGNVTNAASTSGSGSHAFETQTLVSPVVTGDVGVALLRKLGIIPYTTGLNGDYFYFNNVGEFVPVRGGSCDAGANAGVSSLYVSNGRGYSGWSFGYRLAFAV
ncbi:TPA: hypothetical protein DD449_02620 [Candidatus Berkelbacteria bacterium]|nr:hypothetical protein [Candidatus Berkelbacteria bacterium]